MVKLVAQATFRVSTQKFCKYYFSCRAKAGPARPSETPPPFSARFLTPPGLALASFFVAQLLPVVSFLFGDGCSRSCRCLPGGCSHFPPARRTEGWGFSCWPVRRAQAPRTDHRSRGSPGVCVLDPSAVCHLCSVLQSPIVLTCGRTEAGFPWCVTVGLCVCAGILARGGCSPSPQTGFFCGG